MIKSRVKAAGAGHQGTLPKVVVFGGGSALPEAVIASLKKLPVSITTITSMTDDGGSTGALRRDCGVLPPGDIRRHILALSDAPRWKKELWAWRFGNEEFEGGHKGHSFGNVFMAGLETKLANYGEVLNACRQFMMLPPRYAALPATLDKVTLCAKLEDGSIIRGESEIDVPKAHDAALAIRRIFLEPEAKAYTPALRAVREADALIVGPGDLYSSLLPCFLAGGINTAMRRSGARKIFICNIMNKRGETDGFTAQDFVREVEAYLGTELDAVLYNTAKPEKKIILRARKEDTSILEPVACGTGADKRKFIGVDLLKRDTLIHDSVKTGRMLRKLLISQ